MNGVRLNDLIRRVSELSHTGPVMKSALEEAKKIALSGVQEGFNRQTAPDGKPWPKLSRPRISGGSKVLMDSGNLSQSVTCQISGHALILSSSSPYANVHQFGARIVPKVARALAIPLTAEAKRVGSPRKGFPRPLFVLVMRNGGKAFLAERIAGGLVFHYLLVRSVTIPARPFLGFSDKTLGKIERILESKLLEQIYQTFTTQYAVPLRIVA